MIIWIWRPTRFVFFSYDQQKTPLYLEANTNSTKTTKDLQKISQKENTLFQSFIVYTLDHTITKFKVRVWTFSYQRCWRSREKLDILKQKTEDTDLKFHAIQVLKSAGSFDYTLKKLKELEAQALDAIRQLGGNPSLEEYLNLLQIKKPIKKHSQEANGLQETGNYLTDKI